VRTAVGGAVAEIWQTRDRAGRDVVLTPAGFDHILQGHDEIVDQLDEVRTTIEQPDFVTRDARYHHREIHYHRRASGQGLLKVVVQYRPVPPQGTWMGEVVTAYHVRKHKRTEVLLEP
jgi:hypothetical protein